MVGGGHWAGARGRVALRPRKPTAGLGRGGEPVRRAEGAPEPKSGEQSAWETGNEGAEAFTLRDT